MLQPVGDAIHSANSTFVWSINCEFCLLGVYHHIISYHTVHFSGASSKTQVYKEPAVLSPGNRTKQCKFQYVKPVGNFSVICFDVDEKPLGDYVLTHNNFGVIYEISKDVATGRSKNGNFRQHLWSRSVMLGSTEIQVPKLIICEIIFEEFQHAWSQSTNVTETDRWTTYHESMTMPCYAVLQAVKSDKNKQIWQHMAARRLIV